MQKYISAFLNFRKSVAALRFALIAINCKKNSSHTIAHSVHLRNLETSSSSIALGASLNTYFLMSSLSVVRKVRATFGEDLLQPPSIVRSSRASFGEELPKPPSILARPKQLRRQFAQLPVDRSQHSIDVQRNCFVAPEHRSRRARSRGEAPARTRAPRAREHGEDESTARTEHREDASAARTRAQRGREHWEHAGTAKTRTAKPRKP